MDVGWFIWFTVMAIHHAFVGGIMGGPRSKLTGFRDCYFVHRIGYCSPFNAFRTGYIKTYNII